MKLETEQDAFGHAVWDRYHGNGGYEIIERSDGHFAVSGGPTVYLDVDRLSSHELAALEHAHGRVLDIGCSAGRHALYLHSAGSRCSASTSRRWRSP